RRGRQFESGCPDHTYVTDLFATFASVRLAHLWRIGAFWGFRRLRAATILSTVGFHQRLDRGLHLRAARDCHLPAAGVLLVGRGFHASYRATARGARPDTKGQLPVGRRYDRTRLPCFSDGRLGPVSA